MSGKFKTNIDLVKIIEPGVPEQGDIRLSADASNTLVITKDDGTFKHVLDSDALPLPVHMGGTGLAQLGTAGQVLTVNDGATALQWQDSAPPPPGDYVRVGYLRITAQTSFATFQNIFTSTYGSYVLYFSHLMTKDSAAYPCIQFMVGSAVLNSSSDYNAFSSAAYATTYSSQYSLSASMYLSGATIVPPETVAYSCGISGCALITGTNGANRVRLTGTATGHSSAGGAATFFTFGGGVGSIYNIDGFRLYFSNGKFTNGTIAIFGVKDL